MTAEAAADPRAEKRRLYAEMDRAWHRLQTAHEYWPDKVREAAEGYLVAFEAWLAAP